MPKTINLSRLATRFDQLDEERSILAAQAQKVETLTQELLASVVTEGLVLLDPQGAVQAVTPILSTKARWTYVRGATTVLDEPGIYNVLTKNQWKRVIKDPTIELRKLEAAQEYGGIDSAAVAPFVTKKLNAPYFNHTVLK